jgi:hypothetical protein
MKEKARITELCVRLEKSTEIKNRVEIIRNISAYFTTNNLEVITHRLPALKSTACLNLIAFDSLMATYFTQSRQVEKIWPRVQGEEHQKRLAGRYLRLISKEFSEGDNIKKIIIFEQNNNYELTSGDKLEQARHTFCQNRWQEMVAMINSSHKGLMIYQKLKNKKRPGAEIWTSVAALKTINIWLSDKNAEEIAKQYENFITNFSEHLDQTKMLIAQKILYKI